MNAQPKRTPVPNEPEETPDTRGGSLLPRSDLERLKSIVEEASDESFPASDPPSWSPTKAA